MIGYAALDVRWPSIVVATSLVACGRVGFETFGDGGSSGGDGSSSNGDARGGDGGDASTSGCVVANPSTTFPGGLPCADWGGNAAFTNAGLSESSGTLVITPNANAAGAFGRCQRDGVVPGTGGAFAEVSQVLSGSTSTTRLELVWGGETFFIGARNSVMVAGAVNIGVTFTGGTIARWWRMRLTAGMMVFEQSMDGTTWTSFAQMSVAATGAASLRVVATTPSAEPTPGMARFESVNVCP